MATGSMVRIRIGRGVRHFSPVLLGCLISLTTFSVQAVDVGLAGVLGSKAVLTFNGGSPRAVAVGQVVEGVRLVSVQGDQAVIEVDGKNRPLRVGQHAGGSGNGDGSGKVILTADGQGHFFTTGTVNGTSVKFLVDTGASMVSLGAKDAQRIGVNLSQGERGYSQTANGQARVTKVKLDTVKVGDIALHNVDGLVHETDMPIALLGMSFLNRMEMQRDGQTMTLKRRY